MNLSRAAVLALAIAMPRSVVRAQDNVFDARVAEFNRDGNITYQNFIFARTLSSQRLIVQALYLRIPTAGAATYNEVSAGAGIRLLSSSGFSVYAMASVARATDANYFQPGVLVQGTSGRFSASAYVQHYAPIGNEGIDQWLIDPVEAQVVVAGKVALGASAYLYRPSVTDAEWLIKFGPKISVGDKWGATELRVARVRSGGASPEFQLRRLFVF